MGKLKEILKKIIFGHKYSSTTYVKWLRRKGMTIGDDVDIYVPSKTLIDEQYPWLIKIGNHVRITEGVKLLTHDYSWSVIKTMEGCILGAAGKIVIGDNVFIGMNAIITKNVTIGNNVIIGSGSVVVKDCEDNYVYAGVPAKKIMTINEYAEKRKKAQILEAKELAIAFKDKFNKYPEPNIFHEFFYLFSNNLEVSKNHIFSEKINLCCNPKDTLNYYCSHEAPFKSYQEFMEYCFNGK